MVPVHRHVWNDSGECRVHHDIGHRVVRCHAVRCKADGCQSKTEPPTDYCASHRHLARRLVLPLREGR